MPLHNYGVLKGKVESDIRGEAWESSPHYRVKVQGGDRLFDISINIKSYEKPSEVLYLISESIPVKGFYDEQRSQSVLSERKSKTGSRKGGKLLRDSFLKEQWVNRLMELPWGFTPQEEEHGELGLDYIRGRHFSPSRMLPLPPSRGGSNNDLNDKLQQIIERCRKRNGTLYAFGECYGQGLHNVHMNQGNHSRWRQDDGVWQDGGLLIHFPGEERWTGVFLAFQSQAWCTDKNGHALVPVQVCNHRNVEQRLERKNN